MTPAHVQLVVPDPERSARFWTEGLGFRVERREGRVLRLRDDGGADVELAPGQPAPEADSRLRLPLEAPELVRRAHDRLTRDGVEILQPLTDEPGTIWFRCRDPDGHAIELYWESPQRPAGSGR